MIVVEFTIEGPPVSHQTHDKAKLAAWRDLVRAAAAKAMGSASPSAEPLKITVAYYHDAPAVLIDNDNMVKPIQDALNLLVYLDDRQITHADVRKGDINGRFIVRGVSSILLAGFAAGKAFLYVKAETEPDPAHLPR